MMPEQKHRKKYTRKAKMETKETKETKTNDNRVTAILTPEQQALVNRAAAETAEWAPIRGDEVNDFSLMTTPLDLRVNFPEAWKAQVEKVYAFRWCEKTDKRIDELTKGGHPITQWKLCTRTTTPFLEKYVDSIIGCITRLDQVLLFRPWDRHMLEKNARNQIKVAKENADKPENMALKRAANGVNAFSGPEHKIGSNDVVQYEDHRDDASFEDSGDLIVE
jgi:hypothetical protein